ncbi:MAG: hypothetical protein AB198_02775, partial [Parcubacteria bacterium C7867-003]
MFYLIYNFLTFFGNNLTSGATVGIRIGILISILGIGYLVYLKTSSKFRALLSVLFVYVVTFLVFSLPAMVFTFTHITNPSFLGTETIGYFDFIVNNTNIFHNTLREGTVSVSSSRFLELGFDKLMSQILYLLTFIFTLILFYKFDLKKFKAILKNSRPERITSYTLLLLCGSGYAFLIGLNNQLHWVDFMSLFCLIISWFCLWMHAVHTN